MICTRLPFTVVTPELFILVTMIGACSCASASSPNVVPLLEYGLSVVSVAIMIERLIFYSSVQGRDVSLIHYVGPNVTASATPVGGLVTPTGQWPGGITSVRR